MNTSLIIQIISFLILTILIIIVLYNNITLNCKKNSENFSSNTNDLNDDSRILLNTGSGNGVKIIKISDLKNDLENLIKDQISKINEYDDTDIVTVCKYIDYLIAKLENNYNDNAVIMERSSSTSQYPKEYDNLLAKDLFKKDSNNHIYVSSQFITTYKTPPDSDTVQLMPTDQYRFGPSSSGVVHGYLQDKSTTYSGGRMWSGFSGWDPSQMFSYHIDNNSSPDSDSGSFWLGMWNKGVQGGLDYSYHKVDPDLLI